MNKNIIIGTAGHIDHGKTTLIKALTGINTDRLKEEKDRGITIDLGFAYFDLPNNKRAGIVDVPGHEKFIKNMLAGVTGIDLVLLVIAADEGIMPQTQEHLDILTLLGVKKGIIVLTKIDLVDDEWLQLVEADVRKGVMDTFLENAPIVKVSATDGKGLDVLKEYISRMTDELEERDNKSPLRLPIDRVFTMTGFGTIVTGTLIEGTIEEKQELMIYPQGIEVKVRNIQVHGQNQVKAFAGQRVAVNLSGVKTTDITRGDVLAEKNTLKSTMMIDGKLSVLKNSKRTIENWARLRLYHGTKEVLCRVVLLDREELKPGETAFVQLRLEEPTVCKYKDKFVIRYYSPLETIGGGIVLDPNPPKHKRFSSDVINQLKSLDKGNIYEIVEGLIKNPKTDLPNFDYIVMNSGINEERVKTLLEELTEKGLIVPFSNEVYLHRDNLNVTKERIEIFLNKFHKNNRLKPGMSKEEFRSRFFPKMKGKIYDELLEYYSTQGVVKIKDNIISLKDFEIQLNKGEVEIRDKILEKFKNAEFMPPSMNELKNEIKNYNDDIINLLIEEGKLVKINEDIILHREAYEKSINLVVDYLKEKKEASLGELKDLLGTTRKFLLPLLEHFDTIKLTARKDNVRTLYR